MGGRCCREALAEAKAQRGVIGTLTGGRADAGVSKKEQNDRQGVLGGN